MFFNKKDDKKLLPDLPPFKGPSFTGASQEEASNLEGDDDLGEEYIMEKHELPSFPDSLNDKGFSQAAIKDAVNSEKQEEEIGPITSMNSAGKYQTIEMDEWTPSMKKESSSQDENSVIESNSIPSLPRISKPIRRRLDEPPMNIDYGDREPSSRSSKSSDVFVKLDKFYSARKALMEAQQKFEDIDALLRKIRETKLREEQELSAWEKELISIKTRINDIAVNLFEKVE